MTHRSDKTLGMDRFITRRDFLDGVAIGLTGSLLSGYPWLEALAEPGQELAPR